MRDVGEEEETGRQEFTDPRASSVGLATTTDLAPLDWAARRLCLWHDGVYFATSSQGSSASLAPTEAAIVQGASPRRLAEFASGRAAARRALQHAGCVGPTVGQTDEGVPEFPPGYVGSITHSHGRAVAFIARSEGWKALGADLEHDGGDDEELAGEVLTVRERRLIVPALASTDATLRSPVSLLFAAKEAVFKAVFPITRQRFDFEDLEVTHHPASGTLRAQRIPGYGGPVTVRYELAGGWIVVLVAVAQTNDV